MPVFAVIGLDNSTPMDQAVRNQYGANTFLFGTNVWFVQDNGSSKDVCDKLGITDGQLGVRAVVLRFRSLLGVGTIHSLAVAGESSWSRKQWLIATRR